MIDQGRNPEDGPAGESPAASSPAEPTALPRPSEAKYCGNCGAPRDAYSTKFCRACGAPFSEATPAREPTAAESRLLAPRAGFWVRGGAYLIDIIALGVIGFALGLAAGSLVDTTNNAGLEQLLNVLGEVISVGYFVYFWSALAQGRTPGMRALGLAVIRNDGEYLTVGRSVLRYVGMLLSILVFGLGLLWVAWDPQKQGWHDKIAGTFVIRSRPS